MAWFTAVLVRGAHVEGVHEPARMGDLLYRVIQAPDAEAAYALAFELGAASTEPYTDDDGVAATFRFLGLAGLMEIPGAPTDGAEVYSQLVPTAPGSLVVERDELAVFAREDEEELEAFRGGDAPLKPR